MRISDWSSDVCSSDLRDRRDSRLPCPGQGEPEGCQRARSVGLQRGQPRRPVAGAATAPGGDADGEHARRPLERQPRRKRFADLAEIERLTVSVPARSEEHTSELQSLMRNSYAVFCLKKKTHKLRNTTNATNNSECNLR